MPTLGPREVRMETMSITKFIARLQGHMHGRLVRDLVDVRWAFRVTISLS